MDIPINNTGFIPYIPSADDYIKNQNSPLRIAGFASNEWSDDLPIYKPQFNNKIDMQGCVSWAGVQCIEMILNRMLRLGLIPERALQFFTKNGYIINGKFLLSKRSITKLSGTTKAGNNFKSVADTLRHFGIVPEARWPFEDGMDWNTAYAEVDPTVIALGKESLQYMDINYHFLVDKNFATHLFDAPIQTALHFCSGYGQDDATKNPNPVAGCGIGNQLQHSIAIFKTQQNGVFVFDHYMPDIKLLANNYDLPANMQYVVTFKEVESMTTYLVKRADGTEGVAVEYPLQTVISWASDVDHLNKIAAATDTNLSTVVTKNLN